MFFYLNLELICIPVVFIIKQCQLRTLMLTLSELLVYLYCLVVCTPTIFHVSVQVSMDKLNRLWINILLTIIMTVDFCPRFDFNT